LPFVQKSASICVYQWLKVDSPFAYFAWFAVEMFPLFRISLLTTAILLRLRALVVQKSVFIGVWYRPSALWLKNIGANSCPHFGFRRLWATLA